MRVGLGDCSADRNDVDNTVPDAGLGSDFVGKSSNSVGLPA